MLFLRNVFEGILVGLFAWMHVTWWDETNFTYRKIHDETYQMQNLRNRQGNILADCVRSWAPNFLSTFSDGAEQTNRASYACKRGGRHWFALHSSHTKTRRRDRFAALIVIVNMWMLFHVNTRKAVLRCRQHSLIILSDVRSVINRLDKLHHGSKQNL